MQVKQSKHIAPLWKLPLHDVCRMINGLGESWQEVWGSEEKQEDGEVQADYDQRVSGTLAQMLEEMHDLQNLCRVLQPREVRDDKHRHRDFSFLLVNLESFFSHLTVY